MSSGEILPTLRYTSQHPGLHLRSLRRLTFISGSLRWVSWDLESVRVPVFRRGPWKGLHLPVCQAALLPHRPAQPPMDTADSPGAGARWPIPAEERERGRLAAGFCGPESRSRAGNRQAEHRGCFPRWRERPGDATRRPCPALPGWPRLLRGARLFPRPERGAGVSSPQRCGADR